MANDYMTTAEVAKFNDSDLDIGIINDLLDDAPLLRVLAARSINGVTYDYLKKTGAPSVGFRAANDGRENDKTDHTKVTVNLGILDASFLMDFAVAQADERGSSAMLAYEAVSHLRAAFAAAEDQLINNTDSTNGFEGLAGHAQLNAAADAMVIDAGGTTANTGSSVYAIRTGLEDCHVVWGEGGVISIGETTVQRAAGSSTGFFPGYFTPITAWMGLQVGSAYSVARLASLTADAGADCDDDKLAQILELFPASRGPDYFVMNRRSLRQLQASRTATNATGAPAPFPTEAFGVPIVVTDQISSTEALL